MITQLKYQALPIHYENQISAPHKTFIRYLKCLQQWREYLYWRWSADVDIYTDRNIVQTAVDELLEIILLIEYIYQNDNTAIPSIETCLENANLLHAYGLCDYVVKSVPCPILRSIFSHDYLTAGSIESFRRNRLSLAEISKASSGLFNNAMPISLFGEFHQLCLGNPVESNKYSFDNNEEISVRKSGGIHYTPPAIVDYIIHRSLSMYFSKRNNIEVVPVSVEIGPGSG